jgi:hypothetical protein
MKKLIEDAKKLLSEMHSKDISESTHIVHIKYDDPSGKGTASIRVPVSAKNPEHAKKRALDKISRFPHPISGYKNAAVHRVETKKVVKEEVNKVSGYDEKAVTTGPSLKKRKPSEKSKRLSPGAARILKKRGVELSTDTSFRKKTR